MVAQKAFWREEWLVRVEALKVQKPVVGAAVVMHELPGGVEALREGKITTCL